MIPSLKLGLIFPVIFLIIYPVMSINGQNGVHDIVKTKNSERFIVDSEATNAFRRQPFVYYFSKSIPTNWQLTIQNNLSYSNSENAKTVVKIQEPFPSEKFIELAMFSEKLETSGLLLIQMRQDTLEYMKEIKMVGLETSQFL